MILPESDAEIRKIPRPIKRTFDYFIALLLAEAVFHKAPLYLYWGM